MDPLDRLPPPVFRSKSKSISNGVLLYKGANFFRKSDNSESLSLSITPQKSPVTLLLNLTPKLSREEYRKKVSFLNLKMFQWGLELHSSSITSSDDDRSDDDAVYNDARAYEEGDEDDDDDETFMTSTEGTSSGKNSSTSSHKKTLRKPRSNHNLSPNAPASFKTYALRKLTSAPIGYSNSLDSQLLAATANNDLTLNLPVFNKRPLTDTPIVLTVTSPEIRVESDEDYEGKSQELSARLKKISHLNLSDLSSSSSLSPGSTPAVVEKTQEDYELDEIQLQKQKHEDKQKELVLPAITEKDISSKEIGDLKVTKTDDKTNKADTKVKFKDVETAPPTGKASLVKNDAKVARLNINEKVHQEIRNLLQKTAPGPTKRANTLNIPGQTSLKVSPDGKIASADVGSKLIIVMVGLPARGKSYITNKLTRYLNWCQHDCRVFNVGNTRRKDVKNNVGPEARPLPDTKTPSNEPNEEVHEEETTHNADFFSPDNQDSTAIREKWAMDTLDNLLNYVIDGPGSVGIFDATNSTKKRRSWVLKRIQERSKGELKVLFLESICSDPKIIESNIRLKLSGPDYKKMDQAEALKDFLGRLRNYEKAYETIDELEEAIPGFQYVKMINTGKKVVSYNIQGFLASQTIYFLLNFNLCERQIWLTRHGESEDNLTGRIGGDSKLTKRGLKFAKALSNFMEFQRKEFRKEQLKLFSTRLELKYQSSEPGINDFVQEETIPTEPNFCVWTSMLLRAVETGQYFNELVYLVKEMRMLNELGGGKYEGMTYEEIQSKHPKEYLARIQDKLTYRYPGVGGESYLDVLTRLRPLITEVERTTDNLLIISHRVVLRILLAYFLNLDKTSIGELDVPLHTLYCLELKPYGNNYRMYEFDEKLEWFKKVEPDHQKNVKEVGVEFKERRYSVVPTAPPSSREHARLRLQSIAQAKSAERMKPQRMRRSISYEDNGIPEEVKPTLIRGVRQGENMSMDLRKLRGI